MENLRIAVSFDFDSTLDRPHIQDYAYSLKDKFELWIITSRYDDKNAPNPEWNKDVYQVAESLGIPKERIVFTNLDPKYHAVNKIVDDIEIFSFVHIDDDRVEVDWINWNCFSPNGGIRAFCTWSDKDWKENVHRFIKEYKDALDE